MPNLIDAYTAAGMIQFGRFRQPDGSFWPLALNFLLLPSYPETMRATAAALAPLIVPLHPHRLLTTRATTPLGAVVAAETGLPLTYPYGEAKGHTNAYVIEGAYDVGHPTTLLTYILTDSDDAHHILEPARQVGLIVTDVVCLFTLGRAGQRTLEAGGVRVHPLLDFEAELNGLTGRGVLTERMAGVVREWLSELP